jgi:hypothetical protein
VVNVSEEIDRPAPGLIDAIEELAHRLHPDAFPGENTSAMNHPPAHIRVDVSEENYSCAR